MRDGKTIIGLALAAALTAGCHDLSYTAPCDLDPSDPRCPGADATGDLGVDSTFDVPSDAPADAPVDSGVDAPLDAPVETTPDAPAEAATEAGDAAEAAVDAGPDSADSADATTIGADASAAADATTASPDTAASADTADAAEAPPSCAAAGPATQACGKCGSQSRTCVSEGVYGAWSTCGGEGACTPGATQAATGTTCAGALEVATQTCSAGCGWGAAVCALPKGWTKIAAPPAGFAGRYGHAAVWTGKEMIVWGGQRWDQTPLADGARYDPKSNTWKLMATPPSGFVARRWPQAIWTGGTLFLGLGDGSSGRLSTAALYTPATNNWQLLPDAPITSLALGNQSVWLWSLGKIVVSGTAGGVARGAVYSFAGDTWTFTSPCSFCKGEMEVGVGSVSANAVVWGGRDAAGNIGRSGATYDVSSDSWSPLPSPPVTYADRISPITGPLADGFVSTGGFQIGVAFRGDVLAWFGGAWHWLGEGATPELSTAQHLFGTMWCRAHKCWVWGGVSVSPAFEMTSVASMVSFDLDASSWSDLGSTSTLAPRYRATAVDTGLATILWGGVSGGTDPPKDPATDFNDGAIYVP
jgi:hypothetical protein